jgi:hypothetical protein
MMANLRRLSLLLGIGLLALTVGAACGGGGKEQAATPTQEGEVTEETELVLAPIDSLDLVTRESFPVQYAVHVVSGLPDGCYQFDHYELSRDGADIGIAVWNRVDKNPDTACIQVYGEHEETIDLGSDFESGGQYSVHVNDETLTFTAQ